MKWRENVPFTPLTERVTKIEHRRPSCAFQQIRWKLYALRACRYGDCKGLTAFALTDHDTTAGVKEAVAYGQEKGIEVIPGIEFSTEYYGKDIHIVGLFIDEDAPAFQEQIGSFVRAREERNEKMCARLAADGIDISYEKLLEAFPDCVITRGHYSRYLLDHGYVKSLPEAFDRYLGDHTKYFVPREKITPAQAVS